MKTAILQRLLTGDHGTLGIMFYEGERLFSLELPWRDNIANLSCVPAGTYRAVLGWSPRFKRKMIGLLEVPKRAGVRVHSANLAGDVTKGFRSQLHGCIALGEKRGSIDGQQAILLSAPAVRRFEAAMGPAPFILEIRAWN